MNKDKVLNNIYRRLKREGLLGATWTSKRGKSVIAIAVTNPMHDDFHEYLDTCIHEWLHSRLPKLGEFEIRDLTHKYLAEKGLNRPMLPSDGVIGL